MEAVDRGSSALLKLWTVEAFYCLDRESFEQWKPWTVEELDCGKS